MGVTHTLRIIRTSPEVDRIAWEGLETLAERNLERRFNLYRPISERPLSPGQALWDSERERNRVSPPKSTRTWAGINEARLTLETIRACGRSLGALRKR